MTQVKRTALQSSLRHVRERFGDAAVRGVLGTLPKAHAEVPSGTLLSSCVHRGDAVCRFEGTWDPRG